MAITHYNLPDGTTFPHVVNTNQPEPNPKPKLPIVQDQTGFSLTDLEPFIPEPFVEGPEKNSNPAAAFIKRIKAYYAPISQKTVICNRLYVCGFKVCGQNTPHPETASCGHCEYEPEARCTEVQQL